MQVVWRAQSFSPLRWRRPLQACHWQPSGYFSPVRQGTAELRGTAGGSHVCSSLRVLDPGLLTRLTIDASESAVSSSEILEQPDPSGAFHPIAYESRKLTAPEHSICWNCWRWSNASSLSARTSWAAALSYARIMQACNGFSSNGHYITIDSGSTLFWSSNSRLCTSRVD